MGSEVRLLLLNYEFPPMGGGASNATYNIALQLVKRGHSVDVLTSRFGNQPSEETINGVKVYRVTSWRSSIHECGLLGASSYVLFAFFKLRTLLQANPYQILHYFFGLPTGVLSFYSHSIKRKPYVLSLRGSDVPGYDTYSLKLRVWHWILKPVTRRIWREANAVVAVSEGLRQLALKTTPSIPISVIYNGINNEVFKPNRLSATNSRRTIRLLTVSRLINRKGLEYLFNAVTAIKRHPIQLDIVGTGSSEKRLRDMVVELGLENIVRFHGYQPPAELARLYNEADIFVLPSLSESLGLVFLEAMGCGLPIIATHVGGIPEIVKNNENGILVDAANANQIAKAITTLIYDRPLRKRLAQNNASKIRKQFTWDRIAQSYEAVYVETLSRKCT
jgi:glycosyltransferase involved in cell wall biosynthesis